MEQVLVLNLLIYDVRVESVDIPNPYLTCFFWHVYMFDTSNPLFGPLRQRFFFAVKTKRGLEVEATERKEAWKEVKCDSIR